jgi:hypothetical protein
MKRVMLIAGSVALSALAGCGKKTETTSTSAVSAPPAQAANPMAALTAPSRKPGLWVQTVTSLGRTQTMSICFDEAMDKKMAMWGQQVGKSVCEKQSVAPRPGGGWTFSSTCSMGGGMGVITSQGEATGDFGSHYEVKSTSTTTGASMAQMNGEHDMTLTADWKGPCPADMKAGDMTMPGGMKINMLAMTDAATK